MLQMKCPSKCYSHAVNKSAKGKAEATIRAYRYTETQLLASLLLATRGPKHLFSKETLTLENID